MNTDEVREQEAASAHAVHELAEAYNAGTLTETEFIDRLVALPTMRQAPLPDADWYDAIIVHQGPVHQLLRLVYNDVIPAEVYIRAVRPMLDAGHSA